MNMRSLITGLILCGAATSAWAADALQLAADGKTDYQVVIADDAPPVIAAAADELVAHLNEVTGARFPTVRASDAKADRQIILGHSPALKALDLPVDWDAQGPEGFTIRTVRGKLIIAGGPRRGTINGVYTFLEDVVGCRWYTPTFSVIPSSPTLSVGPLNINMVPAFESRYVYCEAVRDSTWAARQRLNTFTRDVGSWKAFTSDPKLANIYRYAGWHVHTLGHNLMLPVAEFDQHPEYFALRDGKRQRDGQACMTNPDLMRFIAQQAVQWIERDPGASIVSISQGDGSEPCQCDPCRAAYKQYGVPGQYMRFVNQVAAEITRHYPDMLVDTLAYQWTRQAPKDVIMHPNVVIRYAPYVACIYHAYDGCPVNTSQHIYRDLVQWAAISRRVWVWSYILPAHSLHPNPVIGCLSRNFKRMRDAGVKGHFVQAREGGAYIHGGLVHLQTYLLAKLTWDPDYDVQQGIEEFARASYGAAAPQIVAYVRMVCDRDTYFLEDRGRGIYDDLYGGHRAATPIKKDKLREMDRLFDEAEQALATDAQALQRVQHVRLAVQYAILRYADKDDPLRDKARRDARPVLEQLGVKDSDPFMQAVAGERDLAQ